MFLRRWLIRIVPPLLVLVTLTGAAQLVLRVKPDLQRLVPLPTEVFATLRHSSDPWEAAGRTSLGAAAAFGLSIVVGIAAAVALSTSRWVQRAFYPYAVFFQTVPIIAIAPMLVIWIGYGLPAVIAAAFIVSIFPVIANTLAGLLSTDPALVDMFRLYRAGRWAALWKLRLPAALPSILTGLRVAAGLAVIGAIVGEFVGGGGLGEYIQTAMRAQSPERVFAAVLLASLLGLSLVGAINLASHLLLRHWHASEQAA
jgi:NitT/TauT family transport system permease protein